MIGRAQDLQRGDVLITHDGTKWDITNVELAREGVRLTIDGIPFVWLYGRVEMVCFQRPRLDGITA